MSKTVSGIMLILLLTSMLSSAFIVQPVKASGTIYIRADGSIDPPTALISSVDNVTYTFTNNINDSIVVERNNIVIDGNGYKLQGSGSGTGIDLSGRTNVTVQNAQIKAFGEGIVLFSSSNNTISGNNITANGLTGIRLNGSPNTNISGNNITSNRCGIGLFWYSNNNIICGNNIADNWDTGIWFREGSNNIILHNNFINNINQTCVTAGYTNVWDDDYPSGGNYWSDYTGIDVKNGHNQDQLGSDGIGDTPYVIDINNRDNYPLVKPYPWDSHDVGVTYIGKVWEIYFPPIILPLKTIVGLGFRLHVNVFVMNYGAYSEVFNVTVYANTTAIDTITNITLASRNSAILNFTWDTAGFAKGNYTIWAYAWPLQNETDIFDNNCTGDWIVVTILGDVDGSFEVDIYDITAICICYDSKIGDPNYYPNCDLEDNGIIDIFDVTTACITYGQKYP